MSRKNVLAPVVLESAKSLAATFTTTPTVLSFQDNISYQINITTSDSTGEFSIEASNDYSANNNGIDNADTGQWAMLPLDGTPSVAAGNDTILININQFPFKALRLRYTANVAGTGIAEILLMARTVGA